MARALPRALLSRDARVPLRITRSGRRSLTESWADVGSIRLHVPPPRALTCAHPGCFARVATRRTLRSRHVSPSPRPRRPGRAPPPPPPRTPTARPARHARSSQCVASRRTAPRLPPRPAPWSLVRRLNRRRTNLPGFQESRGLMHCERGATPSQAPQAGHPARRAQCAPRASSSCSHAAARHVPPPSPRRARPAAPSARRCRGPARPPHARPAPAARLPPGARPGSCATLLF
jgi:hypothetical protein